MTETTPSQIPVHEQTTELPAQGILVDMSNMPIALTRTIQGLTGTIEYSKRHNLIPNLIPRKNPNEVEL